MPPFHEVSMTHSLMSQKIALLYLLTLFILVLNSVYCSNYIDIRKTILTLVCSILYLIS